MSDTKALNMLMEEMLDASEKGVSVFWSKDTAKDAAAELAQLRTELDKCVAWHEGDCSPHAQLEQTIAQLRAQLT